MILARISKLRGQAKFAAILVSGVIIGGTATVQTLHGIILLARTEQTAIITAIPALDTWFLK